MHVGSRYSVLQKLLFPPELLKVRLTQIQIVMYRFARLPMLALLKSQLRHFYIAAFLFWGSALSFAGSEFPLPSNKAIRLSFQFLQSWVDGFHTNVAVALISEHGWSVAMTNLQDRFPTGKDHMRPTPEDFKNPIGKTSVERWLGFQGGEIRYVTDFRKVSGEGPDLDSTAATYRGDIPEYSDGLETVWLAFSSVVPFGAKAWPENSAWFIPAGPSGGSLKVTGVLKNRSCPDRITFTPTDQSILINEEYVVEGWVKTDYLSFPRTLNVLMLSKFRDSPVPRSTKRCQINFVDAALIDEPVSFFASGAASEVSVFDSRLDPKLRVSYVTAPEEWPSTNTKSLDTLVQRERAFKSKARGEEPPSLWWIKACAWTIFAALSVFFVRKKFSQ